MYRYYENRADVDKFTRQVKFVILHFMPLLWLVKSCYNFCCYCCRLFCRTLGQMPLCRPVSSEGILLLLWLLWIKYRELVSHSPPLDNIRVMVIVWEYYQNSSVLDCVTQCSQSTAHLCEQFLQVQQIGFVILGPLRCVQRQLPRVVLL